MLETSPLAVVLCVRRSGASALTASGARHLKQKRDRQLLVVHDCNVPATTD